MRRLLLIASVLLMAADLPPVTLKLGPPHGRLGHLRPG